MNRQGFVRCRIDGTLHEIKAAPALDKNFKHTVEAVVDRLILKPEVRTRLADSVELSLKLADGLVTVVAEELGGGGAAGGRGGASGWISRFRRGMRARIIPSRRSKSSRRGCFRSIRRGGRVRHARGWGSSWSLMRNL